MVESEVLQRTIQHTFKNRINQRINWLLNGPYIVLKGRERGRAFIKRIWENGTKEDPQKKVARLLEE